jgi:hypothetical protein
MYLIFELLSKNWEWIINGCWTGSGGWIDEWVDKQPSLRDTTAC